MIGDTSLSAEECAERGGRKTGGESGWMMHAWVVPGCKSPWGVFSAATPLLDSALRETSGADGGARAGVRCATATGSTTAETSSADRPFGWM
ncbi:MAG: hypothetical protein R2689_10160 [Microthrixaceae bacterium]